MPTRDTTPVGAPCWVDLATSDTNRAVDFYTELFGWTATEPVEEFGGYRQFVKDGVAVGGCMAKGDNPGPDAWAVYLATDDAQKTLDAAEANGGQVVVPAMTVGDLGTMGVLIDPAGSAIGLWQPITFHGTGVFTEPGAPSWFELHTRSYEAALDFYRNVFRWDVEVLPDPGMRYSTLMVDGLPVAGVLDAAEVPNGGDPPGWAVYFGVADTDAAAAKAASLGATILRQPEDTPYGKLATVADPTGAIFKLVAPNDQMPAN